MNGTLKPGDIAGLTTQCEAAGLSDSATWHFELDLFSLAKQSPYTEQQVESLETASRGVNDASMIMAVAAAFAPESAGSSLLVGALLLAAGGIRLNAIAHDPADTNYRVLAQPTQYSLPNLSTNTSFTTAQANALNSWFSDLAGIAGTGDALYTSLNRYQGAYDAGNTFWETAQRNAIATFDAQLAGDLNQEPQLRASALAALQSAGISDIFVPISAFTQVLTNLVAGQGLPAAWQNAFTQLGVDGSTVTNFEQTLFGLDPQSASGSLFAALASTNLNAQMQSAASALWLSAPVLLNVAVLNGGNIRFDVPTTPGYQYTSPRQTCPDRFFGYPCLSPMPAVRFYPSRTQLLAVLPPATTVPRTTDEGLSADEDYRRTGR